MLHDVFICHASEDKEEFVRPLAQALIEHRVDVWYDDFSLKVGDSLRESIDRGLANSRFGVVVLSPNFFNKRWAIRELNGLVAREMAEGRKLLLPIFHNINSTQVANFSPPIADVLAISSDRGLDAVVVELLKTLRPSKSPLVIARDILLAKGEIPPVVSDDWWLEVLAFLESELRYPNTKFNQTWIFPLPYPNSFRGIEQGTNIAQASHQMEWSHAASERKISQLTHPDIVHEFLKDCPGLLECCQENPGIAALYAPQLTIPGFDMGLERAFDDLLDVSREDAYKSPGYGGRAETLDRSEPLCGELIAWRHPSFGNYSDSEICRNFVHARTDDYSRQFFFSTFECLTWLLCDESSWLPSQLREALVEGMKNDHFGWSHDLYTRNFENPFANSLLRKSRKSFKLTRTVYSSMEDVISNALYNLGIAESAAAIAQRLVSNNFIGSYYDARDRLELRSNKIAQVTTQNVKEGGSTPS